MRKKSGVTIFVIVLAIALAIIIINRPVVETEAEVAKCIGKNSELYIQLGCHACETQEKMFGENYQYLNSIDCFFEKEKCGEIEVTPTWIINNQKYKGVQSIETLKELTGC